MSVRGSSTSCTRPAMSLPLKCRRTHAISERSWRASRSYSWKSTLLNGKAETAPRRLRVRSLSDFPRHRLTLAKAVGNDESVVERRNGHRREQAPGAEAHQSRGFQEHSSRQRGDGG